MTAFLRVDESCIANFDSGEVSVLRSVMSEVIALISGVLDRADPVIKRFFPDMYRDDLYSSQELRRYTEDDLRSAKIEQIKIFLDLLPTQSGEVRLNAQQSEAWLRALTDARLALGSRLDVEDHSDLEGELNESIARDPTSTRVHQISIYLYMTYLQESLVTAMMSEK